MKVKKWLSIITLGCTLVSAVLAVLIGKASNNIWYDFSMAVFGSALLGFIMSVIEYNVARRTAMELFWQEARKDLGELRKIKYFNANAPLEKILDCISEEGNAFANAQANYKQDIQKVIDSCLAVADIDLGALDNAYGNLDFFVNGNIRNNLAYSKIYDKIREYRNLALAEKYHFKLLNEDKGSFVVCAEKALGICDKVFEVKETATDAYNIKTVYQTALDDIDDALEEFRCKMYYKKQGEPIKHVPVCGGCKNVFSDTENS